MNLVLQFIYIYFLFYLYLVSSPVSTLLHYILYPSWLYIYHSPPTHTEETMDMTDVDTPDDPTVEQRFNERALWPYFRKIPINIKLAKESKTGCESFVSGLVWLAFAYNVVHVLYVSVLVAADWNPSFISNQNPGRMYLVMYWS